MSSTIGAITNNAANMYNVLNRASSAASGTASGVGGNSSQDYRQNLLNAFNNSMNSGGTGNLFGTSGNGAASDMFKLAADFSSYNKGGFNVAMNALRKGYSGRVSQNSTGTASVSNTSGTSGTSGNAERAQNVKLADASQKLSDASVALTSTGTNSLFKAKEDGTYDMEALQSAVSDFVNAYNDTRSAVLGSNNAKAISTEVSVVTQTSNMQDQLSKIGITVNSDNTLSLNAEKFSSADIGDIKSLFNGTGSYAYSVGSSADSITSNAVSAAGSNYRSQSAALSSMRTSAARTAAKTASTNEAASANTAASETAATQAAAQDVTAAQTATAGAVQAAGGTTETAAEQAAANQAESAAQASNASPYYDGEESTGTIVDLIA